MWIRIRILNTALDNLNFAGDSPGHGHLDEHLLRGPRPEQLRPEALPGSLQGPLPLLDPQHCGAEQTLPVLSQDTFQVPVPLHLLSVYKTHKLWMTRNDIIER